jgi:hypothetical protein
MSGNAGEQPDQMSKQMPSYLLSEGIVFFYWVWGLIELIYWYCQ